LSEAKSLWSHYLEALDQGAGSTVHGLRVVRNGSAAFVAGGVSALTLGAPELMGGVAFSAAWQVGFFFALVDDKPESQEENQKTEPASNPSPPILDNSKIEKQVNAPQNPKTSQSVDYNGEESLIIPLEETERLQLERQIASAIREKPDKAKNLKTTKKDAHILISEANQALAEYKIKPAFDIAMEVALRNQSALLGSYSFIPIAMGSDIVSTVLHKNFSNIGNFFLQTETPDQLTEADMLHLSELQKQMRLILLSFQPENKPISIEDCQTKKQGTTF